jgi:hypothetical protein
MWARPAIRASLLAKHPTEDVPTTTLLLLESGRSCPNRDRLAAKARKTGDPEKQPRTLDAPHVAAPLGLRNTYNS